MDAFFEAIFSHIHKEWSLVIGAPFLSAFLILLAFAAAWIIIGKHHEGRHAAHESAQATKDAHIAFLDTQLGEYKSKLSGATPDEVLREINAMSADLANTRAQLEMISKWYQFQTSERHLSADQKQALATALADVNKQFAAYIAVSSISDPEAQQYAIEIMEAFKAQGFCLAQNEPYWTYSGTPDEVGVLVVVRDETKPDPHAVSIMAALQLAGISAKYDTFTTPSPVFACTVAVSHKPPPVKDDVKAA